MKTWKDIRGTDTHAPRYIKIGDEPKTRSAPELGHAPKVRIVQKCKGETVASARFDGREASWVSKISFTSQGSGQNGTQIRPLPAVIRNVCQAIPEAGSCPQHTKGSEGEAGVGMGSMHGFGAIQWKNVLPR